MAPASPKIAPEVAFGLAVRRVRLLKSVTQEELAQGAGISVTSVARIETGRHGVRLATVLRVAHALKTSGAELVSECERIMRQRR